MTNAAAAWSVESLPEYAAERETLSPHQELVLDSLDDLTTLAPELCIILMQAEMNCAALRAMTFIAVKCMAHYSLDELQSHACPARARAMLIIQVGFALDERALQGISALRRNPSAPAILVVIIAESDEEEPPCEASGGTSLPQELARARSICLEHGADDIISLRSGESLSGHHMLEAVHRVEIQAQKMSELEMEATEIQEQATNEVNATREMLQRKLQVAWKKMMWHLPGRLLESIPGEDSSLQEHLNLDGGCIGVGEYTFVERLGRGVGGIVGTIFKATDGSGLPVAVKVIRRSDLREVSQLLCLEQELCLMQHLPPHPNVTRARTAMHGPKNLYLVMEYSGRMNLHGFIQLRISQTGATALEADIASCVMPQMTGAVAHLHSLAVCHRDIKPGNFIVSDAGDKLSLADFSLAAMLCSPTQRLMQCCGSLPFIAPEVLQRQVGGPSYDPFAADIWSLAMNFVEIRKGPCIIEKILGWVPQHPTDMQQRIEGVRNFPALFAGLSDAGMMNGAVGRMLRLRPEERITITEVIGCSGLGYEGILLPAQPSTGQVQMRGGAGALSLPMAVSSRAVECEDQDLTKGTLLERLGGEAAIRVAMDNTFDLAITNTPLALLLDLDACAGGGPAVRRLYADEVAEYFNCDPGCPRAEASMDRMRSAHMHLTVSDSDFDVLSEHFGAALAGNGVCEGIIRQARTRFGDLREVVTANFHMGAAHARRCGTPAWRAAALADSSGRAQRFSQNLADLVAQHPGMGPSAPAAVRSASAVLVHLQRFLQGEERSPVQLQGLPLSLGKLALVINNARTAFVQAGWQPEEVCILYFSMRDGWDRVRLERKLRKLRSLFLPADAAAWTAIVLSVRQAAQHCRILADLSRREVFVSFLAILGAILTEGSWEDHEEDLGSLGRELGLQRASFDALAELFRSCCARVLPKLEGQVSLIVLGLRPWILQPSHEGLEKSRI